jgi:hypothetical protein
MEATHKDASAPLLETLQHEIPFGSSPSKSRAKACFTLLEESRATPVETGCKEEPAEDRLMKISTSFSFCIS